jgi:hypothetical protein
MDATTAAGSRPVQADRPRLTPELRRHLRLAVSATVRDATAPPPEHACGECGADRRDLPEPVLGCSTCANRFWRRRDRARRAA